MAVESQLLNSTQNHSNQEDKRICRTVAAGQNFHQLYREKELKMFSISSLITVVQLRSYHMLAHNFFNDFVD